MTLPAREPDIRDADTIGFVDELFNEARREKRKYLEKWNRYYRAFRNKTWSEFRASWLPAPSSSEIFPGYHTLAAWMTDQRPVMRVSPSPDIRDLSQPLEEEVVTQKALDMQQVLSSWWVNQGEQKQMEMAIYDTLNFGSGIFKTGWDQSLNKGLGDAFLRRIDPYNCLPDPFASSIDDSRYFMEVTTVPLYEIMARFPERGHLVTPDGGKPTSDSRPRESSGFQVIPMANPGAMGVTGEFPGTSSPGQAPRYGYPGSRGSEDYTKTVLLRECWVRTTETTKIPFIQGGEYIEDFEFERPVWQYTAVANGIVLTANVDNPFDHGELPYVRLPMVEIGEFWSIAMSEHILPAQIALNRLLAALQTNAELVGNPILVEDTNAGISRTKIINRPGGRLMKNPGSDVHWMEPPNPSQTVADMASFWSDRIDRILGISAVARGSNLRRREPSSSVDAVQEASFVRVRSILRNMEEALRIGGNQVCSNIVQFYLEPRTISSVGPNGSERYLDLEPKHFWVYTTDEKDKMKQVPLSFDVSIQAGSSLPISRQARAAEADALFVMGVIDDEAVLDAHDYPNKGEVANRTMQKKVSGQLPQAGQNPRKH